MKTNKKGADIIEGHTNILSKGPVQEDEVKVRITTWIDSDILHLLKSESEERKIGYQTILNQKLRSAVLGEKDPLHERVEKLEKTVQKLAK